MPLFYLFSDYPQVFLANLAEIIHIHYCWFDGDTDSLFRRLKRRVADAGLRDTIRINRAGCLNQCGHGPMIVVYPEAIWYGNVQADDVDEIFEQHLCLNRPVERLRLQLPPGNNKQTQQYPASVHKIKQVEKDLDDQRRQAQQAARLSVQDSIEAEPPSSHTTDADT